MFSISYVLWHVSLSAHDVWGVLGFWAMGKYFLPHLIKVFNFHLLKNFLMLLFSFFCFCVFAWCYSYYSTCYSYGGAFNIAPKFSGFFLTALLFFPFCYIYFHHSTFHLICPSCCLGYSPVRSLQSVFDHTYRNISDWLIFISPRSLLKFFASSRSMSSMYISVTPP